MQVRRPQYAAGIVLFIIGIVLIGIGLPGSAPTQNEPELTMGVSLTLVGAVLAIFGYSQKG
jgi:drug/metabolite transporter (DMT)-like permease